MRYPLVTMFLVTAMAGVVAACWRWSLPLGMAVLWTFVMIALLWRFQRIVPNNVRYAECVFSSSIAGVVFGAAVAAGIMFVASGAVMFLASIRPPTPAELADAGRLGTPMEFLILLTLFAGKWGGIGGGVLGLFIGSFHGALRQHRNSRRNAA